MKLYGYLSSLKKDKLRVYQTTRFFSSSILSGLFLELKTLVRTLKLLEMEETQVHHLVLSQFWMEMGVLDYMLAQWR